MNSYSRLFLPFFSLLKLIGITQEKPKKPVHKFSDEEFEKLSRLEDLFVDTPLYGGREWKTLSIEQLTKICLGVSKIIEKDGGSAQDCLLETAVRCEELAKWMEDNAGRPFYKDSDMSFIIDKPRAVAKALREILKQP